MADETKKDYRAREGDIQRPGDRRNPDYENGVAEIEAPLGGLRLAGLMLGPLVAIAVLLLPAPEGMPDAAWRMTAITIWMVIWWLSEAVPSAATALLPLVLMPWLDVLPMDKVAPRYGHPLIFLFLGGFLLAAGMQRVGLHRRVALKIVGAIGTTPGRIVLGFMLATAFLSMWISNTATTVMMFAVGLSVIDFISRESDHDAAIRNFGVALMLGIAYSASIGGIGTLIGTPPNAVLASVLQDSYDVEISFFSWMILGVPIVLVMLPVAWFLLTKIVFPSRNMNIADAGDVIAREAEGLGAPTGGEKLVGGVFLLAALSWIFRDPLASATGLPLSDTGIAIAAALILFSIPISRNPGRFALDWEAARNVPWGILLLFGGGLALASGFSASGLAKWIGETVSGVEVGTMVLVLLVLAAIVYLTEITSNTASTATFVPILGAVAVGLELAPAILTVPVALGASMAFMMPVATPPNAIVFSYDRMTLGDMVKAGFLLNIIAIGVAYGLFYVLGPMVFGFTW
jgi:sodium-dependent dicarboxylate transporter 2/3/5